MDGTKGLAIAKRVYRGGSDERNGEIAGSPPGSKVTYVFPLSSPLQLAVASSAAKTHLLGTTIGLFTRGAELILLYQVSRNETTA